jgi:hypothetical protein
VSENIGPHSRRILVFGVVGIPTGTKVNSPAVTEDCPELLFTIGATNDFDMHYFLQFTTNLFLAGGTVTFLLRLWKEEEALITTLDAVHVIIHVKETNGQSRGGHNSLVHLTHRPRVRQDHREDGQLDEGHRWEEWELESLVQFLDFISGFWSILFHSLAVTWHFYFIQRN